MKQKRKSLLRQNYSTVLNLLFTNTTILKNVLIILFLLIRKIWISIGLIQSYFIKKLEKLSRLLNTKKDTEFTKVVLDQASKLYNTLLEIYANKFSRLEKKKKKNIAIKNRPESLSLFNGFFSEDDQTLEGDEILEGDRTEINNIPSLPPLEGDEEEFVDIQPIAVPGVKEGKGLQILTPSKLLTRLSVLVA